MGDLNRNIDLLPGPSGAQGYDITIPFDCQVHLISGAGSQPLIDHSEADGLFRADQAEARSRVQYNSAGACIRSPGDEAVNRGIEAERFCVFRDIVDLPVGDDDCAANPFRWNICKSVCEGLEDFRPVP